MRSARVHRAASHRHRNKYRLRQHSNVSCITHRWIHARKSVMLDRVLNRERAPSCGFCRESQGTGRLFRPQIILSYEVPLGSASIPTVSPWRAILIETRAEKGYSALERSVMGEARIREG